MKSIKTFDDWDTDDIERTFGLRRIKQSPLLDEWLHARHPVAEGEPLLLEALRADLADSVDSWNEDELKFKFIAPLISLVRYTTDTFHTFTQRMLSAVVDDISLSGRVDFIVASGKTKPIQPFFLLHEYKKERITESDPRAQLLAEMLAARALNNADFPLYGSYVVGRMWFFVILEGSTYAESDAFIASNDDIFTILSILREAKAIITGLAERFA
jgi:hypothetical protein